MINNLVRKKANLPYKFPVSVLKHPDIYNVLDTEELQATSKISELFIRLNDNNIASHTTRIRLANLQQKRWSALNVLEHTHQEKSRSGYNLIADILNIMHERNISISGHPNTKWHPSIMENGNWPLENIIAPQNLYNKHRSLLRKEGILYLDQIINNKGRLLKWLEYTKKYRNTNKGKTPKWFKIIKQRCTDNNGNITNFEWTPTPTNQ